ncbi:hypothetical protein PHLCEN_2v4761 [Hermanssonia centrifuga]|uniref:Uncharacterized protein n=1 Tax=Hermanssonia centrifuga TaxID=98765 RepID=A0A2R6PK21_9APHY|nr:hypothetical protein PHLCEN_2v4761 [Hermanssonia centrifuga]
MSPQNTTPELSDDDRAGSSVGSSRTMGGASRRRSTRGRYKLSYVIDTPFSRKYLQPAINAAAQRASANHQSWIMSVALVPL